MSVSSSDPRWCVDAVFGVELDEGRIRGVTKWVAAYGRLFCTSLGPNKLIGDAHIPSCPFTQSYTASPLSPHLRTKRL